MTASYPESKRTPLLQVVIKNLHRNLSGDFQYFFIYQENARLTTGHALMQQDSNFRAPLVIQSSKQDKARAKNYDAAYV
jgi:hypothetical protein